jgi:hypothetical protein
MAVDWAVLKSLIEGENSRFKRFKRHSSLDSVLAQVKGRSTFPANVRRQVLELIAFVPAEKQRKYGQSLDYINQQVGLGIKSFPFAVPCNATMYFEKFQVFMGDYTGYNNHGESKKCPLVPDDPGSIGPCSFVHKHVLRWESSNGDKNSLKDVSTREYVKFLKSPQLPPFNVIQDPDQEFRAPGPPHDQTCPGTKGGTEGIDLHSTKLPALITCNPRQPGTLVAQQTYEYSCDEGATWATMDNSQFLLEKSVSQIGKDWVFRFTKRNWLPHNPKGFHFEVEYVIGNPPAYLPRSLADVNVMSSFSIDADIKQYARKVVYTGP